MPVFSKPSAPSKYEVFTRHEIIVLSHGQNIVDINKNHENMEWIFNNIDDYCREYGVENYTNQIRKYVVNRLMDAELINNM